MSTKPVFAGRPYRLIILVPDYGHTEGWGTPTQYLLAVEGFGVIHGYVGTMRKFRRHMKRFLKVRRLRIERVTIDSEGYEIDSYYIWHAKGQHLYEELANAWPVDPKSFASSIDAWTDYPLPGRDVPHQIAPIRPCRIIAYSQPRNRCWITVEGSNAPIEVKPCYVYRKPVRAGEGSTFGLELYTLPERQTYTFDATRKAS